MKKNFNSYFFLFLLFILTLLFEGLYYHYYYKISLIFEIIPFKNQSGYNSFIWNENGIVEILQSIFLLFSIFLWFLFMKNNKKNIKDQKIFIYLYFLGLSYFFFEEISWGQHIFNWETPKFISDINQQNETNFHNTSNLLNELPRHLLFIWCSFSFLLLRVLSKYNYLKSIQYFILPSENLKKISFVILFFYIPNFIVDRFDLYPGHPAANPTDTTINTILDIITFNFIRLSELHELLYCYYILVHSYYLNKIKDIKLKTSLDRNSKTK
tara:strand:- start:65 stop:871 length:807 start_codon:yes stop_codon:yes gene_type:complete